MSHLDEPAPGHYWKTPFVWEPGCPAPAPSSDLVFEPADDEWLRVAMGSVMAASMDDSDRHTVATVGTAAAVQEVFDLVDRVPRAFERPASWWRRAVDRTGHAAGFVLPVLFAGERHRRGPRPEGTIFYMGVLPEHRGRGYALQLVHEATRVFVQADCWRVFCDTGTSNTPMVKTFRNAGYLEREPWQRPLR